MQRRTLLASAPAIIGLAALPRQASADAHTSAGLPAAQRFQVGDVVVTALSDGALRIDPQMLSGVDPESYAETMRGAFRDPETYQSAVNAYVIERGDQMVLVDAGTGEGAAALGPTLGRFKSNFEAAGFAPEDVNLLIATHLHLDHVGGATEGGSALFPNAEMAVQEGERAFWTDPANREAAPDAFKPFFDAASGAVAAYEDRLQIIEGEAEIAPGLMAVPLPGHTPGHMGVLVDGGSQSLLIWGDVVHVPPVQFARPDVTIAFDIDQATAAETRAQVLDRVVADRQMVAGMHMNFPGLANIEPAGDGFRSVPAVYDYGE